MIVVDTNVIVHLMVESDRTIQAQKVFARDPEWTGPLLWRSEFCNVLVLYLRGGRLSLEAALEIMETAEGLMRGKDYSVSSLKVLNLAAASRCSAYDCEFVALAQDIEVPLITGDNQILSQFPGTAISMNTFGL